MGKFFAYCTISVLYSSVIFLLCLCVPKEMLMCSHVQRLCRELGFSAIFWGETTHVGAQALLRLNSIPFLLQELSKRFTAIRKTKGDGNCFYRALGYSYLESLLGKSREISK